MNALLLYITAYAMGFFTAIPVGATQVEIAKRALNNKFRAALMVVLGSVISDVMYGAIALFGLAPYLKDRYVIGIFELAGTVILWILTFFTFRHAVKEDIFDINHKILGSKHLSFFTGFGLAVTNPMITFWWLLEVRFVMSIGLADSFTRGDAALFLLFGGLGLGSYLTSLAAVLYKVKKFVSPAAMRLIYKFMSFVLLGLSFYFLFHAVNYLDVD